MRDVYIAYKKSKGSAEVHQELIKTHVPPQIASQNPQTPPGAHQTQQIAPEGPKSSSNPASQPNGPPSGGPSVIQSASSGGVEVPYDPIKTVTPISVDDARRYTSLCGDADRLNFG